jgi:small-conductance mechanosensitive channel/CRP-like cAMP-binding protein
MPNLTETQSDLWLALAFPVLYCLLLLAGRYLKRRHGVPLGWLYHLLAISLALYVPARILNLHWSFLRHLGAAAIVLSATFLIALIEHYVFDLYLRQHQKRLVPKFFSELIRIVVLLVAGFVVLDIMYDQTIKGLLFAPGIAAVVIGLAMQDLAGNVIAGISLQAGRSFQRGDWLLIDNRYGQVTETNWRSTHLRTADDVSIEVPNREIARQIIVNLNRPARPHAMRIPIFLDYAAPPTRAKDVLLHAVSNAKSVLADPKPRVYLKNFADHAVEYEIKFYLDNYEDYFDICDAIRTNVWYGLRRHGIKIPFPIRTVQLERPFRDKQQEVQTAARGILRQQPLFKCLSDPQLDALLPRGKVVHFGRGEKVIEQGHDGDSMFIIVEGQANVLSERNGFSSLLASLGAGECFGEMSLLTGEKRTATVVAHTDCELVEIAKPVLAKSLKDHPELLKELSDLLARRQMDTEGILAKNTSDTNLVTQQKKYAQTFLDTLRSFFEL